MAQQESSLEALQAQVDVLGIVVQELCRAMPADRAREALDDVPRQVGKLAENALKDEGEDADELRAAMAAGAILALSFAAADLSLDSPLLSITEGQVTAIGA